MRKLVEGQSIGPYILKDQCAEGNGWQEWTATADGEPQMVMVRLTDQADGETHPLDDSHLQYPNILPCQRVLEADGITVRQYPYCPERTADALAGYLSEATIWKILLDVSSALAYLHAQGVSHRGVSPQNIFISDNAFMLSLVNNDLPAYRCPEQADGEAGDIWALGATIFFLYMGCNVFHGMGGSAQSETTPVPLMRQHMPTLSGLIARCLDFHPDNRPSAKELAETAAAEYPKAQEQESLTKPILKAATLQPLQDDVEEYWPEDITK